jgi:tRNA dimethylallyltransferase
MINELRILAGATATGKTALCQIIAERENCSILSADSMLVYKDMDIGTAKPTPAERNAVSYYGIDLATPDQNFSTGIWLQSARQSLADSAGDLIVTGGTGLYIKALTSGLDSTAVDPHLREKWEKIWQTDGIQALQRELRCRLGSSADPISNETNPRRLIRALVHLDECGELPTNWQVAPKPAIVALTMPRAQLHRRIRRRVERMFAQGLIDEVRHLRERYPCWSETARAAIGYHEATAVLNGELTENEAIERICARTRQLAKRQETWFRHQFATHWCQIDEGDSLEQTAAKVLELWHEYGKKALRTN